MRDPLLLAWCFLTVLNIYNGTSYSVVVHYRLLSVDWVEVRGS